MLLLILLLQPCNFVHDIAMAVFNIELNDKLLTLNIKLDKEDLEGLLSVDTENEIDLTHEVSLVQEYVDKNFYLLTNDLKVNFRVESISKNDYFYHVKMISINQFEEVISSFQLKNTCLVETVNGHSNIINFKLNEQSRSFRMHKGRQRIEVQF